MTANINLGNVKDFFESKLFKEVLAVVVLISSLLLFLPDAILKKMYLLSARDKIGTWLGVIFLAAASLLLILLVVPFLTRIKNILLYSGCAAKNKYKKLSSEAQKLLSEMYLSNSYTKTLDIRSATVLSLEKDYFISRGNIGTLPSFNYILNPWVIKMFKKNKELIRK